MYRQAGPDAHRQRHRPPGINEPCLSGCLPHPLYVGCDVGQLGMRAERGWTYWNAKLSRFRGRFQSSSDFSGTVRPVPRTWRRRGGVTGSSAPVGDVTAPPTPSSTRAIGRPLHVVGVGDNRIGTQRTTRRSEGRDERFVPERLLSGVQLLDPSQSDYFNGLGCLSASKPGAE